ncbi:putative metallopeptidase [Paraburkholderia unamae]|uniref:Putative phage metallopeptidase domain-containing protein n=1 Tax=Paraburkholderia unamae TaxID=219649 RepID=A0ABX5KCK3_9BURK|nr:putative metallopeptidase [Paraburkholderia unamae]PVX61252.1 hypothetical protein C7402_14243 [Paraburkholderia unamae]
MRKKKPENAVTLATKRPLPPETLFGESRLFRPIAPADGISEWVQESFLSVGAPLFNEEHKHLFFADIAYLWAAVENSKHMRRVVGQCEEVAIRAGGWQKARQEQQFYEWFGRVPKFLITLDARYALECSDLEWCALVEHELYHVGQRHEFGEPAFTKDGLPKLGIRGHDVEEFVGIVRRYGVGAAAGDTAKLVAAASRPAELGHVSIAHACGTCLLRAA